MPGLQAESLLHLRDQLLLNVSPALPFIQKNAAHQVFAEYPEIVRPAVRAFLARQWPPAAEKVGALDPGAAAGATPQRN